VAATPRLSDAAVLCPNERSCLAFGYDSKASVLVPTEVWKIAGPQLVPVTTGWMRVAGVAVHVGSNWLRYLVALAAVLTPLALLERIQRLRTGALRTGMLVAVSVLGGLFLLLWLFMVAFSNLSFVLLVVLAAGLALASRWLTRLREARSGLTSGCS